jgi:hypothetical protein
MLFKSLVLGFSLMSLVGCAVDSGSEPEVVDTQVEAVSRKNYVEVRSYDALDRDAWYELTSALRNDFDNICGDTFCEGDFSNYESLGLRCSVEVQKGTLGKCVWTFAASMEEVTASTGNVKVHAETFRCKMPVVSGTPLTEFVAALSAPGQQALFAKLPGTQQSLYDGLIDCL